MAKHRKAVQGDTKASSPRAFGTRLQLDHSTDIISC
jgi:hypothetical protein